MGFGGLVGYAAGVAHRDVHFLDGIFLVGLEPGEVKDRVVSCQGVDQDGEALEGDVVVFAVDVG